MSSPWEQAYGTDRIFDRIGCVGRAAMFRLRPGQEVVIKTGMAVTEVTVAVAATVAERSAIW